MGLFLPLVIYTSSRKKYGDWPNNEYNIAKTKFLEDARGKLFSFYTCVNERLSGKVAFGVNDFHGSSEIFETDLINRPELSDERISNNCTILIAEPRDVLRGTREIRNEYIELDEKAVNDVLRNEIRTANEFLASCTPFIFVPGFAYAPYVSPFEKDAKQIVALTESFFKDVIEGKQYETFTNEILNEAARQLMVRQDEARAHLRHKVSKMKSSAKQRSDKFNDP